MIFPALMICWLFVYDLTVGPLAYTIVAESSSTRLRNKTIGLARVSYNIFSITFGVLTPYMLVSLGKVPMSVLIEYQIRIQPSGTGKGKWVSSGVVSASCAFCGLSGVCQKPRQISSSSVTCFLTNLLNRVAHITKLI